ncbi:hypothetical protein, partial [Gracilinema caldarium]|uniref:hypothetical protein n=1 Tax=Gracilinema caldarium TaxID=215591 RepID=UPI0026E97B66
MNRTDRLGCKVALVSLFLVCLCFVSLPAAHAQAPEVLTTEQENTKGDLDTSKYLILWRAEGEADMASELESFTRYILQNLKTSLERDGNQLADTHNVTDPTRSLVDAAVDAGIQQTSRWVFTVDLVLEAQRLSWRMAVYDA